MPWLKGPKELRVRENHVASHRYYFDSYSDQCIRRAYTCGRLPATAQHWD